MNSINLLELIPKCHEAAKSKGFWDTLPDGGQMMMLTIGELGEAQEAHRKGRVANWKRYEFLRDQHIDNPKSDKDFFVPVDFADYIKDSVGDEIADAYIRLCDFVQGYDGPVVDIVKTVEYARKQPEYVDDLPANFGAALLSITSALVAMHEAIEERQVEESAAMAAMAFHQMELLAQREGIDLATHIDLKLRYNATRPRLHAKAY